MQNMESTKKKLPMVWIAAGIMVVLLFCVGLTFALAVLPLQKATNAYNMAVSEYNVYADAYNALIGTTSVANLDGFPSSADKLSTVDANLSAVVHSFLTETPPKDTNRHSDYSGTFWLSGRERPHPEADHRSFWRMGHEPAQKRGRCS